MFAHYYAGEPVTVIEDADTLILDFGDGHLCRLKKDQVKRQSQATSKKRFKQASHESKPLQSRSIRRESLAKVIHLNEKRGNHALRNEGRL